MKTFVLACVLALVAGAAQAEVWVINPPAEETDIFRRNCPTPTPAKPDKEDIAPPVYVPPPVPHAVPKANDDTLVKVLASVAAAVVGAAAGVAVQWKKTHPSV